MSDLLDELVKVKRNLTVIGSTAVADPENWKLFKDTVFSKIERINLTCTFILESDNLLFQKSLRTDTGYSTGERVTFTQLKFRRQLIVNEINKNVKSKNNSKLEFSSLTLPFNVIVLDENIWYMPSIGYPEKLGRFKKLSDGDPWFEMIKSYIDKLKDHDKDGRYLSKLGDELLELFDQDRVPQGIFPRNCFYNTDHYQWVVWGFVFNRNGELLIHKRSENAKDNQGMWDKSVGGHVHFSRERSSSKAAARELIEELCQVEKSKQTGKEFSLLIENIDSIYYIGEWRPEGKGGEYLSPICQLEGSKSIGEEPWCYYRLHGDSIERNSPRILPNEKGVRRLRVLADVFFFIANTHLSNRESLNQLKNSEFDLVSPSDLKTWMENGKNCIGNEFKVTPDLEFIMSGKLRDVIDEVSQLIKYSNLRKQISLV